MRTAVIISAILGANNLRKFQA